MSDGKSFQKWAYQMVTMTGDLAGACNQVGQEGWEVVQIIPQPNQSVVALCKKPASLIVVPPAGVSVVTS